MSSVPIKYLVPVDASIFICAADVAVPVKLPVITPLLIPTPDIDE